MDKGMFYTGTAMCRHTVYQYFFSCHLVKELKVIGTHKT